MVCVRTVPLRGRPCLSGDGQEPVGFDSGQFLCWNKVISNIASKRTVQNITCNSSKVLDGDKDAKVFQADITLPKALAAATAPGARKNVQFAMK